MQDRTARGQTAGAEGVGALTDEELLAGTRRLVCQANRVLAALLAHLAEVEARGLHRSRACATLYTYCVYELRMSEDTAFRRVAAARLVKRFPVLFGAVERGELHLTGLIVLGPHLTESNVAGVLERAKFRTKKEIMNLVRLLSPLPDVPSRIEPLGPARPAHPFSRPTWSEFVASLCPVRELQPDERPCNWLPADERLEGDAVGPGAQPASAATASHPLRDDTANQSLPARDGAIAPSVMPPQQASVSSAFLHDCGSALDTPAPSTPMSGETAPAPTRQQSAQARLAGIQRYKVQFTASAEYVALVEEAKDLLAHSLPRADVAEIHLRALRTLVAALKRRKYASPAPRSKYEADMSSEPNTHESPASPLDDSHSVPPSDPALDTPPRSLASILRKPNAPLTEQQGPQPRAYVDEAPGHIPRSDPLPKSPRRRGRHVPAAVRRAVLERDGHRCAYVDARGLRCRETSRLELHHHEPFARGGPTTPENVSLYCAAHNALAAEQDFGRTSMIGKREHPHITQRALTHEPPHK